MMIKKLLFTTIILSFVSYFSMEARNFRVAQIPYGEKFSCALCHEGGIGGAPRNAFGQDVEENLTSGNARWDLIFNLDSDGDGYTNGEELQDPDGSWTQGDANPGDEELVTRPWDDSDFPEETSVKFTEFVGGLDLFPMPAKENINLRFNSEFNSQVIVTIVDILGNKLNSFNKFISVGENTIPLNFSRPYNPGTYFIIIKSDKYLVRQKFIISD